MKTPEQIAARIYAIAHGMDADSIEPELDWSDYDTNLIARISDEIEAYRAQLKWTNEDGIAYEPFIEGHALGYKLTETATGRVEYVLLNPTEHHEINTDNRCTADTFFYHVDQDAADEWAESQQTQADPSFESIIDYGEPVVYVNHFYGSWQPPSPDDEDWTEL